MPANSSSARTEPCLEEGDAFLHLLFLLLSLFVPDQALVFGSNPVLAEQNKSNDDFLLGSFLHGPVVLNSQLCSSKRHPTSALLTAAFAPPSRRSNPFPHVIG